MVRIVGNINICSAFKLQTIGGESVFDLPLFNVIYR